MGKKEGQRSRNIVFSRAHTHISTHGNRRPLFPCMVIFCFHFHAWKWWPNISTRGKKRQCKLFPSVEIFVLTAKSWKQHSYPYKHESSWLACVYAQKLLEIWSNLGTEYVIWGLCMNCMKSHHIYRNNSVLFTESRYFALDIRKSM